MFTKDQIGVGLEFIKHLGDLGLKLNDWDRGNVELQDAHGDRMWMQDTKAIAFIAQAQDLRQDNEQSEIPEITQAPILLKQLRNMTTTS